VDPRIEVIAGDAFHVMPSQAPFDLLFADSGVRDRPASRRWSAGSASAGASSWTT